MNILTTISSILLIILILLLLLLSSLIKTGYNFGDGEGDGEEIIGCNGDGEGDGDFVILINGFSISGLIAESGDIPITSYIHGKG